MPDAPNLTRTQRAAVKTLGRSVSVAAGAGSGKTEVLIRHFCHIVEKRRAAVDGILTVTFTEKAAKEMQSRIRARLDEIGCRDAAIAVDSAFIGTIHGFCRRILRENPIEACVDPGFAVLSEADSGLIAGRVLDRLLGSNPRGIPDFLDPDAVKRIVMATYDRLHAAGLVGCASVLPAPSDPRKYLNNLTRCADNLLLLAGSDSARVIKLFPDVRSVADRLVSSASDGKLDWESARRLSEFDKLLAIPGLPELIDRRDSVRRALSEVIAACMDAESDRHSRALLRIVSELDAGYAEEKESGGFMDYDDLLWAADSLLIASDGRPTPTAMRYRERLKFVILDEFQDTNRLQKRIIDSVSRPDNVFTVGDAKQSIFSFARADIEVFHEHQRMAKNAGALFFPLRENFRSRLGILRFINELFSEIWREDSDADYRPLTCAGRFGAKRIPDVEILSVEAGSGGSEAGRRNEAEAIAHRILEITGKIGDAPLRNTGGGREGRPISFGDIVILLRSTAHLATYESALRGHGIDAQAVSGRGFYNAPEVQWLMSMLRVARDPLDDEALGALLGSPFVGVRKSAVDGIRGFHGSLWCGLKQAERLDTIDQEEQKRLIACREMISDMLGIGISAGIAKMLEIVLHRYGFMDHLAALPDGRRRCANARKLLEMASCFGKRELPGVDSFLDYVHKLRYSAEREADSDSSEVDAVRLMTVHKAKGLQSPVIFVADMSRNMERSPGRVVFDPDFGLAMEVKDPLSGRIERSMGFKLIADRVARREISEEKRLLYVAMTRAEEHLILVGHSDLKGVSESSYSELRSWTGWLEKALRLGPESKSGILRYGGTEVDFRRDPKSEAPKNAATHERSDAPKIARHARIELPFSPRELSVSGVLDYLDCPARFRLRHVLGLSEGGRFILRDEDESPAAALGTRVHGILESADFKNDDPLSVLDPLPEEVRTPVERFYGSRWFREIHAADLVIKEKFFRVRASDARVIGRMDVVYHGSDGWTILDYKTGRGEDRERYELQVGIYSFAVKRLFGEFPARSALLLLSADEEWVVETSDGDAARRGMDAVNDVYSSVSAGRFDPKPGDSCNHCSYSKICQNQG